MKPPSKLRDTWRSVVSVSLLFLILLSGCGQPEGEYIDASDPTPVSEFFSDTDLNILCDGVAVDVSQKITQLGGGTVMFFPIGNRTADRIDMRAFTQRIATALIKSSGGIKVVNRELRGLRDFEMTEMGISSADAQQAREFGADYAISGRLSSISTKTGRNQRHVYYLLSYYVTRIEDGLIVHSGERELKKNLKRDSISF